MSTPFFVDGSVADRLKRGTLVLPAVAYANVGELAMDVLISSLSPQLVGYLEDDNVMPVVGNDAFSLDQPGTMCTAMELYELQGCSMFFLQQRAPAIKGRQGAFADSLTAWIQQHGFAQVVVLCGLDAQPRTDAQILGTSHRYLTSDDQLQAACSSLGLSLLEEGYLNEEKQAHSLLPPWPLLNACSAKGLPALLLTGFASEGDNMPDGLMLAHQALQVLHHLQQHQQGGPAGGAIPVLEAHQMKQPCSWMYMYGRSIDYEEAY